MTTNELKYLRSLHQKKNRYKEKLFLSEGEHLAEEVLKSELYKPLVRKFFFTGEFKNEELPIITNMDFGHTDPQWILPLGIKAEINCEEKTFKLKEKMFK